MSTPHQHPHPDAEESPRGIEILECTGDTVFFVLRNRTGRIIGDGRVPADLWNDDTLKCLRAFLDTHDPVPPPPRHLALVAPVLTRALAAMGVLFR